MAELAEMVLFGRLICARHRNLRSVLPSMLIAGRSPASLRSRSTNSALIWKLCDATRQKSYAGDGNYPNSYYVTSRNIIRTPVRLQGRVETDICVVGAGYSGMATAIHLAEKGYKVVVVEGAQVGWGASGRNGGQIVNGLNASLATTCASRMPAITEATIVN